MPDLSIQLGPIRLKNPVLTASGTCGYGRELSPFMDLSRLGGFTTKSVTLKPRKGNPPERIVETAGGMINAIGLANVGLEEFLSVKLPAAATLGTAVFVNVAGHSIDEYVQVCRAIDEVTQPRAAVPQETRRAIDQATPSPRPSPLKGEGVRSGAVVQQDTTRSREAEPQQMMVDEGIAGVELNVSCPNVADGLTFGTDPSLLRELVTAVRQVVRRGILIVKLSPNVTDITVPARAAIDAGADALSMINTYLGMKIDIATRRPALAYGWGGVSGPAIKPMAIYLIHRVYTEVARDAGVPIIGIGGVSTWQDTVEFILAGATAVSVGTALFVEPDAPMRMIEGLEKYLADEHVASIGDLVGRVQIG